MNHILTITFAIIMILVNYSGNAQINREADINSSTSDKVEVYYFHLTTHCVTSHAIEDC